MASSPYMNSVCNQIHDVIQSSGLHFAINQTPWSSFITIRRKFIDPNHVPSVNSANCSEDLSRIRDENLQLRLKNIALKEALACVEEGHRGEVLKHETT